MSLLLIIGLGGCALALAVVAVAALAGDWPQFAIALVWLALIAANTREWHRNSKRRAGFFEREKRSIREDQIRWTEQVMLAKSLVAGRFADEVKRLGLQHDAAALSALASLFDAIAKIELPEGSRGEVVTLKAKAAEAAEACHAGSIPTDRVLH